MVQITLRCVEGCDVGTRGVESSRAGALWPANPQPHRRMFVCPGGHATMPLTTSPVCSSLAHFAIDRHALPVRIDLVMEGI